LPLGVKGLMVRVDGDFFLVHVMKVYRVVEAQFRSFLPSALDGASEKLNGIGENFLE